MVSFQCDACQDVVKKPKLDNHRARCNASFTCIDCSTTFAGPHQYKAHTSCISEAQKYEKGLYKGSKGTTAANGGYQNGRQNGRGYNQSNRSRGTGSNGQPLGDNVKMTWTPPNEETIEVVQADTAPVSEPAPNTVTEEVNETPNKSTTEKKKKPKKKKEPPPPGETRAERKKRKKIERTAKKAEKLKMKAQMRAAKAEALAAKRKAKLAEREEKTMQTRSDGPAPYVALPEDTNTNVMVPPTAIEETQVQLTKSKQRLEEINGGSEMQVGPSEDVEKTEKRKKKKKSKGEESAAMDIDSVPVTGQGDEEKTEKKSKKRKRDVDDVGGEDGMDETAGMSFKERAKAEKRARKAEKAARKALQASTA